MTQRTIEIVAFVASLLLTALAMHAWLASHEEQQRLQSTMAAQKKVVDAADVRENTRNATLADALAQIAELKRTTQTPEQIVRDFSKYLPLPQPITLSDPTTINAATNLTAVQGKTIEQGIPSSPVGGTENSLAAALGTSPRQRTPLNPQVGAEVPPREVPQPSSLSEPLPNPVASPLPDSPSAKPSCDASAGCKAQIPLADLKPLDNFVQDCRACQAEIAVAKQNIADDAVKMAALTNERDAAVTAAKGGTFWRRVRRNAVWFAVGAAAACTVKYAAKLHDRSPPAPHPVAP
jgi:hypothetical protein